MLKRNVSRASRFTGITPRAVDLRERFRGHTNKQENIPRRLHCFIFVFFHSSARDASWMLRGGDWHVVQRSKPLTRARWKSDALPPSVMGEVWVKDIQRTRQRPAFHHAGRVLQGCLVACWVRRGTSLQNASHFDATRSGLVCVKTGHGLVTRTWE